MIIDTGHEPRPEDCLVGGGQMGAMMRGADWGTTPLGTVRSWPQSLRTALSMMLASRFAMVVAWGPELRFFYNDRFQAILGAKHPRALGAPGSEIFPEIWHLIGPELERVRRGESVAVDDWLLPLERNGERENCWFTISCSPIRDESGGVAGLLSVVWETTVRVEGERRLTTLHELAACAAEARGEQQVCASIAAAFERNPIDVPFAVLYALDEDGRTAHRLAHPGLPVGHVAAPAVVDLTAPEVLRGWPLARVVRTGASEVVTDLPRRFGELWGMEPGSTHGAILLPLSRRGLAHSYGVLVAGISPRRSLDDRYRRFFELAAEHLATAIANARALEGPRPAAGASTPVEEAAGWLPDAAVRADTGAAVRGERVLIADDDPTTREYLRDVLESHWRVTAVGDGAAALAELRRAPPDVIVTDVMMPGLDGFDLLRVVRGDERTRELPVIMLSASAGEEDRVGGLQAGADDYLVKPFSARELVARVASQLAASASRRAAEQHRRTLYALFEHLPAAIAVLRGEHLVYEMANRRYLQDRSLAEIVGRPAFEVAPHLRHGFAELIEHVRRTGEPFAVTEMKVVPDLGAGGVPEEHWWHVVLVPLADEHGGRDRIMLFSYDVTELVRARQRAEATAAELQKSVSLIDATLSSVPVGLAFFDRELRFVRVNPTLARWSGWEPQRLIGRALADFAPPGSYEWIAPRVRDAFATERASEPIERTVPGLAPTDEPRHWLLTFYPVRPASAGVELVGLVVVDVTAHKRALFERAEALAREARAVWEADAQKAYVHQLFMQAPVPICILRGPRLVIELANERCCEAWRRSRDEVIGRPLFEALCERAALVFEQQLQGVLETGEPYVGREMPAVLGGDPVYFNFVYSPMRGADGAIDGILVIATDVTDEVRAREELSRTIQYNEKFTAILGHDLRNPLNAIMTTAQLLKRRATSDEIAKPAARIIRSGERMLRMITQLFDLARVRVTGGLRLEPKHVDLAEVCRHVMEELRVAHPGSNLELVAAGSMVGRWDGDRLAQVLSNLGANALEHGVPFMPVSIRLDGRDPARVVILVENQGAIPEALLPYLFDPFPERAPPQRERARARARAVHLEGDRDCPPRHDRRAIEPRRGDVRRDRAAEDGGGDLVMVLVVEDEVDARDTLRDVLEDEGYRVVVARDGNEAMRQLASTAPTLVILDLLMPGMSGNALYDEMQRSPLLARIPVLVTTSDPTRAPRGVPTLEKPIQIDKLLSLVALASGRA